MSFGTKAMLTPAPATGDAPPPPVGDASGDAPAAPVAQSAAWASAWLLAPKLAIAENKRSRVIAKRVKTRWFFI